MVLESTTMLPGLIALATPSAAKRSRSTAAVSETHIQTTSASRAAPAGEEAVRAPSMTFGVRFQTETVLPALTRLRAIALPMIPKPRNATFISTSLECDRIHAARDEPMRTNLKYGNAIC